MNDESLITTTTTSPTPHPTYVGVAPMDAPTESPWVSGLTSETSTDDEGYGYWIIVAGLCFLGTLIFFWIAINIVRWIQACCRPITSRLLGQSDNDNHNKMDGATTNAAAETDKKTFQQLRVPEGNEGNSNYPASYAATFAATQATAR